MNIYEIRKDCYNKLSIRLTGKELTEEGYEFIKQIDYLSLMTPYIWEEFPKLTNKQIAVKYGLNLSSVKNTIYRNPKSPHKVASKETAIDSDIDE